eukprot:2125810-Pyramimonas_sp.AAC.1
MQHVDWESLLTDPAGGSATVIHFMAARHLNASMALESEADELFEELFAGHGDVDLAEWLGVPIAGQPADI